MIRASASAAVLRPTVGAVPRRRPVHRLLVLSAVLATVATAATAGQSAAAADRDDRIQVSAEGVAFERGRQSDEVAYVVRSVSSHDDGRAFSRELTREEQYNGWASFGEASSAYPGGYCVVWVEVEDASSWHTSNGRDTCTAAVQDPAPTPSREPAAPPTPQAPRPSTPDPAGRATQAPEVRAAPVVPTPERAQEPAEPTSAPAAPPPSPSPAPSASPSATPSAEPSGTPSPSASALAPQGALVQDLRGQQAVRTQVDAAGEQDEVISPLGWVAVLGGGALLTVGGALLLLRRLT